MEIGLEQLRAGFRVPPREFSPVPVWWWSGDRLDPERLRWQMERFVEGGVYNLLTLNLAPTGPLYGSDPDDPPFLSEAWWQVYEGVCRDAEALGVRLWFYDQIGFASANLQGALIRENPEFAGAELATAVAEGSGLLEVATPLEGTPLSASLVPIDEEGRPAGPYRPVPLDGRVARAEVEGAHRLRLVYSVRRGFDYLSREACARLLDTVHGEFERRLGRWFGRVIVGSFQDELPALPTWSTGFAAAFADRKGYDLLPRMASLWEGEDLSAMQVRIDYQQVRAELAEEAFFKPFFEWHERRGLLCGFDQQAPARGGSASGGVKHYGDYLRTHRWYGAPGCDHSGDGKIHSSLAHQYGRPRVWIEAFHSSGWGGTLEETFDWLLPWFQAGANLYNPHAAYYSTRGGWYEWAPPSTCWRQPYWRHYKRFADAVSRLSYILAQGSHQCDVAVLFPTMTAQASAKMGESIRKNDEASEHFLALIGAMHWSRTSVGVLDRDGRDFEVLGDEVLERAEVRDGRLAVGGEAYRALILPGCRVVSERSAEVIRSFVEAGGLVVAIGRAPEVIKGERGCVESDLLSRCFAEGKAKLVAAPEEVPEALSGLPRRVSAPVPTLHRRVGPWNLLFVPAAFPKATEIEGGVLKDWWRSNYTFDAGRYQRPMRIRLEGPVASLELWDPLTGECRPLPFARKETGTEVELLFEDGPAALLVWREETGERAGAISGGDGSEKQGTPSAGAGESGKEELLAELDGAWSSELIPTLDNRHGDFDKPDHPGSPPVATWYLEHRIEEEGHGGESGWRRVKATFGPYAYWAGPVPAGQLAAPGQKAPALAWKPAEYSRSRGRADDPLYVDMLGPKGHVPEEFLLFGEVEAGQGVHFYTHFWLDESAEWHLALGAPALKRAWLNGEPVAVEEEGYLSLTPVSLKEGLNRLDVHLIAESDLMLRAYWALVRDAEAFRRPEWIEAPGAPEKDGRVAFRSELELSFEPEEATLQVATSAPCRVLVNGEEVGRQGSFESYGVTTRVQPYAVRNLKKGTNTIVVEALEQRRPAAVLVDGIARGEGSTLSFYTNRDWRTQRGEGKEVPARLRRRQWLDPSWCHLWRRPHPLPQSAWLEARPAGESVVDLVPDARGEGGRVEWFRWILPPGAHRMKAEVAGEATLWVDGELVEGEGGRWRLPRPGAAGRRALLRVAPERGRSGGAVFDGPITYEVGEGSIEPGDWQEQGLESYSGGVAYRKVLRFDRPPEGRVVLDLGRVRGTAEVIVNGSPAGVRVLSPYTFELSGLLREGENLIEVQVFNTLAPYLRAVSPTHYIFPGQTVSGLFGPVRLVRRVGGVSGQA